jgi:hypothetical protein
MKSLFEKETSKEMVERVEKLSAEAPRQWGKMNVAQMVAHCGNALDMASGTIHPKRVFIGRIIGPLIRKKYSDESIFTKGSPTSEEIKVESEKDFHTEKQRLKTLIEQFTKSGEKAVTKTPHPFFGPLTPREWGIGMYKHLDHHLRQFGG